MSAHASREISGSATFPEFKSLCQRLMLMARGAAGENGKMNEHGVPSETADFVNWVGAVWRHEILFNLSVGVYPPFEYFYISKFTSIKGTAHVIMDITDKISREYKHFNAKNQIENPSFLMQEEEEEPHHP